MAALRSALFVLIFYGGTLLWLIPAFAAVPLGRDSVRAVANAWARYHRGCAAWLLGIRTRAEGPVPTGPALVMKRELADLPLWGALAHRYGIIPIDRAGGAGALRRMLRAGEAAAAEGRPIVIFPEGTRVAPGEAPPLQPGFAGLYRALGLPVVPVALDSGRLWPRRGFVKRPGVVTMRFGEPIPPGLPRKEVEARVHAAINAPI